MTPNPKENRVLALAPTTRGLGFAVLEGNTTLVDWGVKSLQGDKNTASLARTQDLINHYKPSILLLENDSTPDIRRAERVKTLNRQLSALASENNVLVMVLTRLHVRQMICPGKVGTKQEVAEALALKFPKELGNRLPPKRRLWTSLDYRMAIFDAVALTVAFRTHR
jgi:hypothetical protein